MPDLLLELYSEEIPARMQASAAQDLRKRMTDGLVDRGLTYVDAAAFVTPRRLTLAVTGLTERSPDLHEERKGPRTDAPDKALEGFLRSTGLTRDQLDRRADTKGDVWFAVTLRPGRPASEIVAETLEDVVRGFPWPKSMRWGTGDLRWVRPLQSILCILSSEAGAETVPVEIDGLKASDVTFGHPFMAPAAFTVTGFEDYEANLQAAFVRLNPEERRDKIAHDAAQMAFAQGLEVVENEGLLTEITGLVEWPVVLTGRIEERFLDLPPEVLRTSMKEHQKFLSLRDPATDRIVGYVVVANRETADDGATILAGNAKVLAARLSDAKFFWENDLARSLADMAAKLGAVTFHNRLGSQGDRIGRIAALAQEIAPAVGADPDLAERAARLAKADLSSEMVYEFPELQGVMGRYYALKAGEDPAVADAARDHYAPLGPSDAVPTAPVSVAVALADKLDMLTGFWAIDEKPTGSKDPFALRRAALGVIRIVLENGVRTNVEDLVATAFREIKNTLADTYAVFFLNDPFSDVAQQSLTVVPGREYLREDYVEARPLYVKFLHHTDPRAHREGQASLDEGPLPAMLPDEVTLQSSMKSFIWDRLKVHLRDDGVRHDVIDAVLGLGGQDDLVALVARVQSLRDFLATDDGANLLIGFRRANNILIAEEKKDGVEYSLDPQARLAETDAERALFAALDRLEAALGPALEAENFAGAMALLAELRAPIDAFFDTTTVNTESDMVRRNRLCLLNRIRAVMGRVAVFSEVEGS